MPSSFFGQIPKIMEFVKVENPRSVLDIGIGFGKYGVLCREDLDICYQSYKKENWQIIIDGIEGFEYYQNPIHDYVYNKVYYGLIQDVIKKIRKRYDLGLMIDVLEHFEKDEGEKVLNRLLKKCKSLLISVPAIPEEQSYLNNNLETHRSIWTVADFKKFRIKNVAVVPMGITNSSIIILLEGENNK